jgi:anaerobic nitric oxide reductase flavorubredoxin
MKITKMSEGITQLSVNIDDILFEGLWEMPNGVTLNSYVVEGEKIALIDGVCGWDGVPDSLFKLLDELEIDIKSIQYLVLNHLEPDHAGWIEDLRKIHEDFEILCTDKGADLFEAFFGPGMNIRKVTDGDSIDLGKGKVLSFTTIPHVHWPDSMVTYELSSETVFSCDAFGTFGIFGKSSFDDDYTDEELAGYERDTIRYYSNIIATFSPFVLKAVDKLMDLSIKTIAPGHGLVWRSRVGKIIGDYVDYARYQKGDARKEVTLIWGSMYGMTGEAAEAVMDELKASGIRYHAHQVPETSWGDILTSVWTSSAVILGMPTYEYKMFPPMAAALEELGKKKVHGRKAFRFGSYGWSGGAQKELDEISERYRWGWSFIEPHEFKGKPSPEDLMVLRERVRHLVEMI